LGCIRTTSAEIEVKHGLPLLPIKGCTGANDNSTIYNASYSISAAPTLAITPNTNFTITGNVIEFSQPNTTYTISSTTTGCSTIISIGDCEQCKSAPSNSFWIVNRDASSFPQGQLTTSPVVIDDNFNINTSFKMNNNPDIKMAYNANINLNNPPSTSIQLEINSSILKACNNGDWLGISSDNSNEETRVIGSEIWHMTTGINSDNNAKLHIENSLLNDNAKTVIDLKNYTNLTNFCVFKNNTIQTVNGIQGNFASDLRTRTGISLINCNNITIGGNASNEGNTFHTLRTGILINNGLINNNTYSILNNYFSDIKNPPINGTPTYLNQYETQVVNNTFIDPIGSAIFAKYASPFTGNIAISANASTSTHFADCDRGIVANGYGTTIQNQNMESVLLGIMISGRVKSPFIKDNQINNCYIGMELSGSLNKTPYQILNNIINTTSLAYGVNGSGLLRAPIAISVKRYGDLALPNNAKHEITGNTIKVQSKAGTGIYQLGAENDLLIIGNSIEFNNTASAAATPSQGFFNTRALYGIKLENTNKVVLKDNGVFGNPTNNYLNSRSAFAYEFENAKNNLITCNTSVYTRTGMHVIDNALGSTVHKNTHHQSSRPWLFYDIAAGTNNSFGNIGAGNTAPDPANNYNASSPNWLLNPNNPAYVYRYTSSTAPFGDFIYSNFIQPLQSKSSQSNGQYNIDYSSTIAVSDICNTVTNNANYIPDYDDLGDGENDDDGVVGSSAQALVTGANPYSNYQDVAAYIDQQNLFAALDADPSLLNNNASLAAWYNAAQSSQYQALLNTDEALHLLESEENNTLLDSRYNQALTAINAQSTIEQWQANDALINTLIAKELRYSLYSFDENERSQVISLANSCPYIAGSSVHKARVLHAIFEPGAWYDDRLLCLNSSSKGVTIDLENEIDNAILNKKEDIKVSSHLLYPNPASDLVFVSCTEGLLFNVTFYSLDGKLILNADNLTSSNNSVMVDNLPIGLYTYKIIASDGSTTFGKINITR
jgi:hypothetical protein